MYGSSSNLARTPSHTPRRNIRRSSSANIPPQTPDFYGHVTVETPYSAKKRQSKEKCDQEKHLTVAVRVRPMNTRECSVVGVTDIVKAQGQQVNISINNCSNQINVDHVFQYDHVFVSKDIEDENFASQEDVFTVMGMPLLDSAFNGYNACLFAYGQTGSGKSYSMMGPNHECSEINDHSGIIPRFCKELFNRINTLPSICDATVEINYFEIYNEKIHDLLLTEKSNVRTALKVREHPEWGPYVVNLSVQQVKNYKEMYSWLLVGNKNRATAATVMNENSSRSHSIFTIEISLSEKNGETETCRRSKISLIDLAGSERLTNMHNDERIKQGVSINKSLMTLGKVISALADKKGSQFVPYRDSVLTWLLRESLGGNSLTTMLATITPASSNLEETLSTLRYACQARSIVNRARINENPHDKLIRELRAEVERLRALRQNYQRTSLTCSLGNISQEENQKEFEELKSKLSFTENQLEKAEKCWEQRFMESNEKSLRELMQAEKQIQILQSRIKAVTNTKEIDKKESPFRTAFINSLESALGGKENQSPKKMTKREVAITMNQVFELFRKFQPTVECSDNNLVNLYTEIGEKLQNFEDAIVASVSKKVTFDNI